MSTTALVTVENFLQLPEPQSGHYELHHGEIVLMAPPKWGHEKLQERIREIFNRMIGDRGTVRMEMAFQPAPEYEVWRADVGVVRKQRADRTGDDEYLQGAPDLVLEVLPPGNTVEEINDKMAVCLENGCTSFWVVDGKRKEIQVTEGDITRHYKETAAIGSKLLGGTVHLPDIFEQQQNPDRQGGV
jgi:Uma2 family endonuclease